MAEPTLPNPKIFIVYIDDSLVQRDRVRNLSDRLRREGFEARIDAWEPSAAKLREGKGDPDSVRRFYAGRERAQHHVLFVLSDFWTRQMQEGDVDLPLFKSLPARNSPLLWPVALSRQDAWNCPRDVECLDLSGEAGYRNLLQVLTTSLPASLEASGIRSLPLGARGGAAAIWHVPFSRDPTFTGSEELLERLRQTLTARERFLTVVLAGPAGGGKSQAAREYVYRHRAAHRSVLWLQASTPLSVSRGLREVAMRLGPLGAESLSDAEIADVVADWLCDHSSSLLVFDGADRPAAIPERFLAVPPCPVLITSRAARRSNWGSSASLIKVSGPRRESFLRRGLQALGSFFLPWETGASFKHERFRQGPMEPPGRELPRKSDDQTTTEAELCTSVSWGAGLLERLRKDRAGWLWIRCFGEHRWLLRVRLPEALQEAHGTAPDVLLLVANSEIRGGDLQRAQEELYRRDLDLDPDLLLIVDGMPRLGDRLERMFVIRGQWIPWSQTEGRFTPLAEEMRHHLPTYDIFEARDPVRGRQVVGRHELVSDLSRRLLQGQAVGVFGLRKVGKTTLVRAVTDRLDPVSAGFSRSTSRPSELGSETPMARVIWLDLERIYERTLETVAEHLLLELERRLSFGSLKIEAKPLSLGPFARLEGLLAAILRRSDVPLIIVLDEYDLLFEGVTGQPAIPRIHQLFQLLRGHSQQSGRLGLVAIGRDPESLQQPEMGGWPNPVLNWIIPRWLGPLGSAAATELLTGLGRRVLLDVGKETAALAGRWTGGHPLLQRQFGSALLALARQQGNRDRALETDPFCQRGVAEFLERDAVLGLCREVEHLLASRYPEAAQLLESLCRSPAESACTFLTGEGCGSAQHTLKNFGLLLGNAELAWVPEVYRWYFRNFAPQLERRPA